MTTPATNGFRLKRILLPVDLAAPSEAAIVHAHWWARRFGAVLDFLYVVDEGDSVDAQTATDVDGERGLEAEVRDLNQLVERLVPEYAPQCQVLVRRGRAAPTIASIAASTEADLIVMGSHGRTRVGRWVLGSVVAEVLREAVIPVLIVRDPTGALDRGTFIVAVDFSDASEAALRYAGQLAADCGASLCLVHALPIGEHHSAGHAIMRETATKALEDVLQRDVPSTVRSRVHVEMGMGAAATTIAHYAEAERASLIVMGGHGQSGWTAGLLGSVTNRVIHETTVPVLVVRPVRPAST